MIVLRISIYTVSFRCILYTMWLLKSGKSSSKRLNFILDILKSSIYSSKRSNWIKTNKSKYTKCLGTRLYIETSIRRLTERWLAGRSLIHCNLTLFWMIHHTPLPFDRWIVGSLYRLKSRIYVLKLNTKNHYMNWSKSKLGRL